MSDALIAAIADEIDRADDGSDITITASKAQWTKLEERLREESAALHASGEGCCPRCGVELHNCEPSSKPPRYERQHQCPTGCTLHTPERCSARRIAKLEERLREV